MKNYECMFILRPDSDEEKINEVMERLRSLIENHGGEVTKLEKWGKRRLAYQIQHLREGIYMIILFKGNPEVLRELDHVLKITDSVIRHIIVHRAA